MSLWGNLSIGLYKLVVGIIGGSTALIADAVHSFSDVIGSTGILIATKISSREPNEDFPYGLGKAEFVGALFVYTLLLFIVGWIAVQSIRLMLTSGLEPPHFVTLLGAVVSVLYNYTMYKYTTCVGMRNHSPAILADAFENRADAISSGACIAGILGGMFVHPICDPIAALMVGAIIMWNCQDQLRHAADGLMDAGLGHDEVELVRRLAMRHEGVVAAPSVRTRRTGARYWVDLQVAVQPGMEVAKADMIAAAVRDDIKRYPTFHHAEVFVVPAAGGPDSDPSSTSGTSG
jgi:cation diffusion facilitator family transporter